MGMGQDGMAHHSSSYKKPSTSAARATLTCVKFSHPFQNRSLDLELKTSVKIGRSGPHISCASNNAIFDCVVISRDHARIWFEDGKFYLQDTKSSNGTFVNNDLIGEKAKDSPPKVVYTGDIVQFGSAVFSPDMKARLGSIIAVLRLYLPDGTEAPTRPPSSLTAMPAIPTVQLYQLSSYLEEAEHREQKLRKKLAILQHIVEMTCKATNEGWKALVNEDLLLTKVDFLQKQVDAFSNHLPDDKLRLEMVKLNESQYNSHEIAKKYLENSLLERNEAILKSEDLERCRDSLENECTFYKTVAKQNQDDLKDLGQKYTLYFEKYQSLSQNIETGRQTNDKCKILEEEKRQLKDYADKVVSEKEMLEKCLMAFQNGSALGSGTHLDLLTLKPSKDVLEIKGVDPSSTIKSKFSVTVVKPDLETIDRRDQNVLSNLEQNCNEIREEQIQIDHLVNRFERMEQEENLRVEKLNGIKLQIETFKAKYKSSEQLKLPAGLKECIEHIEAKLSLIWSENNRSSKTDGASVDNTIYANDVINNLKAENSRLSLQLTKTEETLRNLEAKKDLYQMDFKTLTLKSMEAAHEIETLKKKLHEAQFGFNVRNNTIFELRKQKLLLEKSAKEDMQHITNLENKLHEELLQKSQLKRDSELRKEEFIGIQETLKKCQAEYDKLKTSMVELEARWPLKGVVGLATEGITSEISALRGTCESLQIANENLKLKCLQSEESKKTYQAAQDDFIALNEKLFEQMCVIEQMQADLAGAERERAMFGNLVRELTETKQVCALKHEENADLMKKIDSIQTNSDPTMRYFMPLIVVLVFIFAIILFTRRQPLHSLIYGSTMTD